MPDLAVHVRHVTKYFVSGNTRIEALKNVNFDTRDGEVMMIVGPSGSGKTTLISVIAGVLHPDSGEIDIYNTRLDELTDSQKTAFRKVNVGFIFQQYNLIPTLNILENVSIPLLLNNYDKRESEERAAEFLEKVGLKGREYVLPKYLSGGQQQRVAIARALVHEPRLLICDEPTASLDAETGAKIMDLLISVVKQKGRCAIIVTHDNRIFKFADRIAKMDDGRVLDAEV